MNFRENKSRKIIIILAALLFLSILSMALSYIIYGTFNSPNAAAGWIKVTFTDSVTYQAQKSPKIIIFKPGSLDEALALLEKDGYSEVDQLGSIRIFEKGGKRYTVNVDAGGHFSSLRFEK